MKILCPTDFSPRSHVAAQVALALAQQTAGAVELLHVVCPCTDPGALAIDVASLEDRIRNNARTSLEAECRDTDRASFVSQLRALVPADAERRGITTHVTVIDGGKAALEILRAAERFTVDAIVLGAHGRGAAYRALIGSVSAEVVRLAHRPVLVVPRPKETS